MSSTEPKKHRRRRLGRRSHLKRSNMLLGPPRSEVFLSDYFSTEKMHSLCCSQCTRRSSSSSSSETCSESKLMYHG